MSGRETNSLPGANLPSVSPWRKRRSQRRKSLKRRTLRWVRACWPFAFVGAAALLSAGVVDIVESTASRSGLLVAPPLEVPRFHPVDNLLDIELFDQEFYWDPSRIDHTREFQGKEISLDGARGGVDEILPETFLGDPSRLPAGAAGVDALIDFRSLPSVDAGPPHSAAPEPATLMLFGCGLALLAAATRKPRSTPPRS